jgi:hypothetical protein
MLVFTHQSIMRHIAEHGDLFQQLTIIHLTRSSLLQCSQSLRILPTKQSCADQSNPHTQNHSDILALYQINILNSTVLDKSIAKYTS